MAFLNDCTSPFTVRICLEPGGDDPVRSLIWGDPLHRSNRRRCQKFRSDKTVPVSTDLVYGLVNTRTDGRRFFCGTLEEVSSDFDFKLPDAGIDVD